LRDYSAALADIDVALEAAPSIEEIVESGCGVLYDLNRLDDAITACSKAIQLDPNNEQAYNDRGLAYDAKDDAVHEALEYRTWSVQSQLSRTTIGRGRSAAS
jgi:tetratricopeptide (TPR) repeat protein